MNKKPPFLKTLLHNGGWKLVSVIVAACIWFVVTNYNDPVTSVSFYNIPVTLTNTDYLSENGKAYQVMDNTDTIPKVTITASRSIVEAFTRDDISATADVTELTSRDLVPIHITLKKNQSEVQNVAKSVDDVKLDIEDSKSRTISLQVQTKGQLSEGYIVGDTTTAQNLVRISGAASKVDSVARAMVEVDVTGFTSEIATIADVRLYDEEGNVIRDAAITQNIASVNVKVSILQTKSVPIKIEYQGTPANGYMVTDNMQIEPAQMLIAGTAEQLAAVREITPDGDEFNVNGLSEDLKLNINIKNYLPQGICLADSDSNGLVSITIPIAEIAYRELELPWSRIELTDMPEGTDYTPDETPAEGLTIRLSGLREQVENITADQITGRVNVTQALGDQADNPPSVLNAVVTVELPDGIRMDGKLQITLKTGE